MEDIYITENTNKKNGKRYKCPYCDKRDYKSELVDHIEKEHEDMIPEGYTAARIVFNIANKKERGTCVCGCGRETPWREDVWRYDRYATPQCKEKYSKEMKQRMVRVYGKEHLLNDPDMQEKMLSNRSISGTYKFTHGGSASYVGSYELKLLEFLDKVMGYRATDIETPGPIIEYYYLGEKHIWITDTYLIPYNLVFDAKDGGDNPNNREMKDYRAKQDAKEAAIIEQGKYNYIRLTNNNFSQLMLILAELKMQLMNYNEIKEPVVRIFESSIKDEDTIIDEYSAAIGGAMVGIKPEEYNTSKIVSYIPKNSFNVEYGVAKDENMEYTLTTDDKGNIKVKGRDFFKNECTHYCLYEYSKPLFTTKLRHKPTNIVEAATGKRILHPEQLIYDPDFKRVMTNEESNLMMQECFEATMMNSTKYPVLESSLLLNEFVMTYQDDNGYFIENVASGLRSKSFESLDEISDELIHYISKGKLLG